MEQAAIAAVGFLAGAIFVKVWPLVVRWVDTRSAVTIEVAEPKIAHPLDCPVAEPKPSPNPRPFDSHRRLGIAERRRLAELQSIKPLTHQAEVTAKNIKAMEQK